MTFIIDGTAGATFPDSSVQASAAIAGIKSQTFTANGTFTIPTGITALKATIVGGGAGGTGGGGGSFGGNGGDSSVASGTQTITTVTAGGGNGSGSGGTCTNGTINITGGLGSNYISHSYPGAGGSSAGWGIGGLVAVNSSGVNGVIGSGYGAGGGGGTWGGNPRGGGGGATNIVYFTGLTPGNTLSVTVGSGGTGSSSTSNGANGTQGIVIFEW